MGTDDEWGSFGGDFLWEGGCGIWENLIALVVFLGDGG